MPYSSSLINAGVLSMLGAECLATRPKYSDACGEITNTMWVFNQVFYFGLLRSLRVKESFYFYNIIISFYFNVIFE